MNKGNDSIFARGRVDALRMGERPKYKINSEVIKCH